MTRTVYFDNAATTPMHPEVVEAMLEHMRLTHGNPSSIHAAGRAAKAVLEKSRRSIAQLMGCSASEIFFTSGGTESDNTALSGLIDRGGIRHLISSPIEHHAITHTLEYLGSHRGIPLSWVNVKPNGHISLSHLEELLAASQNALVSLMHGNNEIGNMIDLDLVGQYARILAQFFTQMPFRQSDTFHLTCKICRLIYSVPPLINSTDPKASGSSTSKPDCNLSPSFTGGHRNGNKGEEPKTCIPL